MREVRCDERTPLGGDAYWWIGTGHVRVHRLRGQGERMQLVDLIGPGAVIGPSHFGTRGDEAVLAEAGARLLEIHTRAMPDLAAAEPDLVASLVQAMSVHHGILRRRLGERIGTQVPEQLASMLRLLGDQLGQPCVHGRRNRVDLHGITHQDLADLLGSSRPYVSHLMGFLQKSRAVSAPGAQVLCISLDGMAPS